MALTDDVLNIVTDMPAAGMWRPTMGVAVSRLQEIENRITQIRRGIKGVTVGGVSSASTAPTGIPKNVLSVSVAQSPLAVQAKTVSQVTVTFTRDTTDKNYDHANIWVKGYKGNTNPVEYANTMDSPANFILEATGDVITVYVQAASAAAIAADPLSCPSASVTLSGVVSAPPAPSISQTLIATPLGYQFTFTQVQLSAGTQDVVSSYNVYRNTVNNSATATLWQTIKHDPTNAGGSVVVQDRVGGGQTYYYWVTSVNTAGLESAKTAAQSGTVTSGTANLDADVSDGTNYRRPNIAWHHGIGVPVVNTPVSAIAAITSPTTGPNTFSRPGWITCDVQLGNGGLDQVFDVFISDQSNANAGYMFRVDNRSGNKPGQILKVTNVTTSSWANIETGYVGTNAARLTQGFAIDMYLGTDGYLQFWHDGVKVADATDTTYTPSGTIKYGNEVNGTYHVGISPYKRITSTHLIRQGSLTGIPAYPLSYTSTTSSVTWTWAAFTVYRLDNSTISVASGSSSTGGLSASTTYYFDFTYDVTSNQMLMYLGDVNGGKAKSSLQRAANLNLDSEVAIANNLQASTPASGTGSGSGTYGGSSGYTCFSPETLVKTARGCKKISEIREGDRVYSLSGALRTVTKVIVADWKGPMVPLPGIGGGLAKTNHRVWVYGTWREIGLLIENRVPYDGPVYNLHVEADTDDEHSYTLAHGTVVHNYKV